MKHNEPEYVIEFENWWKSNGVSGFPEATAFDLWKAARKEEENDPRPTKTIRHP